MQVLWRRSRRGHLAFHHSSFDQAMKRWGALPKFLKTQCSASQTFARPTAYGHWPTVVWRLRGNLIAQFVDSLISKVILPAVDDDFRWRLHRLLAACCHLVVSAILAAIHCLAISCATFRDRCCHVVSTWHTRTDGVIRGNRRGVLRRESQT